MIRTGRPARDRSERMILDNFRTMQHITKLKNRPLSRELVLELHELVTRNTLEDASAAGRFRLVVQSQEGDIFHTPPTASELEERMTNVAPASRRFNRRDGDAP